MMTSSLSFCVVIELILLLLASNLEAALFKPAADHISFIEGPSLNWCYCRMMQSQIKNRHL